MAAKLTRLTHKIAIHLHLVAESCTICSSSSRWPVRKLLDTYTYRRNATFHNSTFPDIKEKLIYTLNALEFSTACSK